MTFDPYKSVKPYFAPGAAPAHVVSEEDKARIQSYDFYENAFWNVPETFKVIQRGFDTAPIYLPSARKMIEAVNRFFAQKFNYLLAKDTGNVLGALVLSLFKREKFFTKFATQKRYGLIRGDAMWHIVGDPEAAEGERLSIYELHPGNYFPIMEGEKRIGCHLVDVITDPADPNGSKQVARVQTYRKEDTGAISSVLAYYEVGKWDDRNLKAKDIKLVRTVTPKFDLPPEITSIPVYDVPNNRIPGPSPFSYSEVLGIERVYAAVNQAISDEELSLAMAGLGVFWTNAGPPRDAVTGAIVPWDIGPARMIEVAVGSEVGRLAGITSVAPMIDHMNFMLGEAQSGLSIPDVAAGKVDVTIAESGISLQLQLSPLLAHTGEKEGGLIEEYDRMFYDLVHMWFPAYEGTPAETETTMVAVTGDPMPRNRKADVQELIDLKAAGLLSAEEVRQILTDQHGYRIAASVDKLLEEQAARATAEDPFSARAANELNNAESGQAGQENRTNGAVPVVTVPS
jgi:hypothetical protein